MTPPPDTGPPVTPPRYEDWLAIVEALNRIGALFDARDWDGLADVILADATCYGDTGLPLIIERSLRHNLGGCGPSQHLLGNYQITVDGDTAVSHTKVRAFHRGAGDRRDRTFETMGTYHDRWVRTAGGWRMTARVFDVDMNIGDISVLQPG
ncbi:MAG TPA: nuclear transport factor 2 family protein [Acidimicrobiales bacterium]|nr:nuclear transport factor 2 family protein [Acidimicrobiales bacterium]